MFCICWPSSKVATAGLPKGVWTQRCVTSVRDPELRPPGAHISTSGTGLLSGKAGTEMQCRWVVSSSSLGKCTGKYPPGLLCLVLVCCTCRRYSGVRAAGHQHGLHLWALHLRRHPAGPQRDSAAVQRRSTAHSVYKQVCVLDEYCSKKKIIFSPTYRWHLCLDFWRSLQGTLDLNSTLKKAEHLLYNYCKRCTWDCINTHCRAHKTKEEDFFYQLRNLLVLKW